MAKSLETDWMLYSPQQAAVVAAALFTQIRAAGAAMEQVEKHLLRMADRGDVDEALSGDGSLGGARGLLRQAGEEARAAARDENAEVALALQELVYLGPQPADAHETVAGVAGLLDGARLNADAHVSDPVELSGQYADGFGCGCRAEFLDRAGALWGLYRGDSEWCLMRLDRPEPPESRTEPVIELSAGAATAHPAHLATQVRQILSRGAAV